MTEAAGLARPAAGVSPPAARLIDGTAQAAHLLAEVARDARQLADATGIVPGLAVVLVGDDPASRVYVNSKRRRCGEAGIRSFAHVLPADIAQADLLALVARLNDDASVHGILVQLPLPPSLDTDAVLAAIDPDKDVDGFHPVNAGRLATGLPGPVPCTPLGCLLLLRATLGELAGLEAVVVGRSNIVGKPMAQLLLREGCTVTVAHSRTRNLPAVCARADILVVAVGRPLLVRGSWIKGGATVIDVGINRVSRPDGRPMLVGDVDFAEASERAAHITPVPGGVGPMTIACLLRNTLEAARTRGNGADGERGMRR